MEDHHNGVSSTQELEAMISDHGVLFREYRGDGFLVVGEDNIFVVKDHENNDFEFSELSARHLQELKTTEGYPTHRLERKVDEDEVEKNTQKPCTEATLWTNNHTLTFYVDAPVYKVAAAFVNFKVE